MLPFHCTTELAVKFAPSTTTPVIVTDPVVVMAGFMEARKGPAGAETSVS